MGKGSGTQTTTQNTTGGSTTSYPAWTQPYQQGIAGVALAQNIDKLAPSPYSVAGFNPDQLQGMDYARRFAGDAFGEGSAPNYMTGTSYQEYMNPWLRDVGKTAVDGLRREHENNVARAGARAANTVAFGGSGASLERAQLARGMNEAVPEVLANIMAQGHDRATANAIAARGLNNSLDNSRQARQMSAIQGLLGTGQMQQDLAQRAIDIPRDALRELAAYAPGVYNTSSNYWSNSAGTQPDNSPSLFQQLLGGGLTIAGMGTSGGSTIGGDLFKKLIGS